jgi:hypothetical protein
MPERMDRTEKFSGGLDLCQNAVAMRIGTTMQPVHKGIDAGLGVENVDCA